MSPCRDSVEYVDRMTYCKKNVKQCHAEGLAFQGVKEVGTDIQSISPKKYKKDFLQLLLLMQNLAFD